MKKSAPKSRSKSVKKSPRTTSHKRSWWDKYCADRDDFYRCHPHVQWLLAIFIVLFLVYLSMVFAPVLGYRY